MPFGRTDPRTYGKALKYVPGWDEIGKVRRFDGTQKVWFARDSGSEDRWISVEESQVEDDLLG